MRSNSNHVRTLGSIISLLAIGKKGPGLDFNSAMGFFSVYNCSIVYTVIEVDSEAHDSSRPHIKGSIIQLIFVIITREWLLRLLTVSFKALDIRARMNHAKRLVQP